MPRLIKWLAEHRINILILQIDYRFAFESRADLRGEDPLTRQDLATLSQTCAEHGIALIPQFSCLSHQDSDGSPSPLLRINQQFEEAACGAGNLPAPIASTREWCPSHPGVHKVVLPLIDEIVHACNATAIHVGLDEVMHLGSSNCPLCAGKNRADLFATEVNHLHEHFTKSHGLQMLMWGDRLIDGATMDHGPLESSHNGTARAIDLIPRDIIICDWHYETREEYPSVEHFANKGFRLLPAVWRDAAQAHGYLATARQSTAALGTLFTTWSRSGVLSLLPGVDDSHHDKPLMAQVAAVIESTGPEQT